jgi:hypothetical protein
MKFKAEKSRSERQFSVGDWVFLKLQPYAQSSLAPRANQKLAFKFFGPFQILQKIGQVAYKLALPENYSVHPIFHVSQLKQAVGSKYQMTPYIPIGLSHLQVPEKVLRQRLVSKGSRTVRQALIKWSALLESLSTWEDLEALKQRFPAAPTWGQAVAKGGGVTTTDAMPDGDRDTEEAVVGQHKSRTRRRPNVRVFGPEWSSPLTM